MRLYDGVMAIPGRFSALIREAAVAGMLRFSTTYCGDAGGAWDSRARIDAAVIWSGPARALATELSDRFAWAIIGGSAWTRSVCTVIASVVPSALVMLPR